MNRVLVSEFPLNRRCETCDVILSSSLFDTRPVAIRIRKINLSSNSNDNRGNKFECIHCATKEYFAKHLGKKIRKTSLEEVANFFKTNNVKCINIACNDYITGFVLKKLQNELRPSVKNHICYKCRRSKSSIEKISCFTCGNMMYYNENKMICNDCDKDHNPKKKLEELITN